MALAVSALGYACALNTTGNQADEPVRGSSGTSSAPASSSGEGGGPASSSDGAGAAGGDDAGGAGGAGGIGSAAGPGGSGGSGGSLPLSVCGNGAVEPGEACDDGNTADADRCASDCSCGIDDANAHAYKNANNGHCYVWVTTPTACSVALGACAPLGMYNATVTSEQERLFLGQFINISTWLGGKDEGTEGTWYWLNGEPWATHPCNPANVPGCDDSISFWNTNQPSGGMGENCLAFRDDVDKMHDWPCASPVENLAYLCEK